MIHMQQKAANMAACVKPTARETGGQPKRHTNLYRGALCAADPAHSAPTGRAAFASSRVFRAHIRLEKMEGENEVSRAEICTSSHRCHPPERNNDMYARLLTAKVGVPRLPLWSGAIRLLHKSYKGRQRGRGPPWKRYFDKGRFA